MTESRKPALLLILMALFPLPVGCSGSVEPPAGPRPAAAEAPPAAAARSRSASHAGSWYPEDPRVLRETLGGFLAAGDPPADGSALALVAPHAGVAFSGEVAGRTFAALRPGSIRRVFLLGPSHYVGFEGIALPAPDLAAYDTPLGPLPVDHAAVGSLRALPGFQGPASAHDREHSLEMHAIFLAARLPGVPIVPLVVGRVPDEDAARSLARSIRPLLGEGDAVVVSTDFTHYGPRYGYLPFTGDRADKLERLASAAAAPLLARDPTGFERHLTATGDTICGRDPLRVLLALLPPSARGAEVARDTSARITGDDANSVTYLGVVYGGGSWAAAVGGDAPAPGSGALAPDVRRWVLAMVRRTLEIYLGSGRVPSGGELGVPAGGPLHEERAAFVTLKKHGVLRGCIGHIFPAQSLWLDLRDNAIAAAVRDPRFPPVHSAELPGLELEVSVLTPPRPASGPEAFEVGRHGVVLQAGGRRAVFLPQVASEQGWDRETTLSQLARKAGLGSEGWRRPDAAFLLFEAQVFGEGASGR